MLYFSLVICTIARQRPLTVSSFQGKYYAHLDVLSYFRAFKVSIMLILMYFRSLDLDDLTTPSFEPTTI